MGLAEPVAAEGVAEAGADGGFGGGGAGVGGAGMGGGGAWGGGLGGFFFEIGFGLHAEGDAISGEVDFDHSDVDVLADFDDFAGVFDEVVGELADVDEAVLVDADVDEGAEGGDVGDDAGEFHADLEVGGFFDIFGEGEGGELLAGVAARFGEFGEDIAEGGEADFWADVLLELEGSAFFVVADEVGERAVGVAGHLFDERIALGVDSGGVEGVIGALDAEEGGGLFEGFIAEAGDVFEFGAGAEGAVGVAELDDIFGGGGVEAGDVAEELFGGGIEFDADGVDAALDAVVEGIFEEVGFDVVLVLADSDGFGVDFDEFG